MTFWVTGRCSNQLSHIGQGKTLSFVLFTKCGKKKPKNPFHLSLGYKDFEKLGALGGTVRDDGLDCAFCISIVISELWKPVLAGKSL